MNNAADDDEVPKLAAPPAKDENEYYQWLPENGYLVSYDFWLSLVSFSLDVKDLKQPPKALMARDPVETKKRRGR